MAARLALRAASHGSAAGIEVLDGKPHQVVLVPMKAPVVVGWVLMGFPLDQGLAEDMHKLSSLGLTLLTRERPGASWTPTLTSLAPDTANLIGRETWRADDPSNATLRSLQLADEEFGVQAKWLTPDRRRRRARWWRWCRCRSTRPRARRASCCSACCSSRSLPSACSRSAASTRRAA